MSGRAWLAACLLAIFIGGVIGWGARACTADHRYIRALAQRHEAEASYWLNKINEQIQINKGDIAKGRENDGAKKN